MTTLKKKDLKSIPNFKYQGIENEEQKLAQNQHKEGNNKHQSGNK